MRMLLMIDQRRRPERNLWDAKTDFLPLRCSSVLVNQPAQHVVPNNRDGLVRRGWSEKCVRRSQFQAAVGPLLIVMLDVGAKHPLQVAPTPDENPVKALPASGKDPPLGEGIGFRRPHRRSYDPGALCFKDIVEGTTELGIPIVNQKARCGRSTGAASDRFLACWVIQAESGLALTPPRWTRLLASSMKKRTYKVFSRTVSTVKKSQAKIPWGWDRRN